VDVGLRPRLGSFGVRLAVVGVAAIAIRLIYVLVIARAPVGVGGDASFYHSAANLIAHGHFYYRGILGHAYPTAEHPPLYPLLLSVSWVLGGGTLLAHRIVSCVLGSCAVVLIGLLGRGIGRERIGSSGERAGLLAASIAALYSPLVTADGLVMSEPLFVLTVVAALLLALHLRARPSLQRAGLLGAIIGLASLTRGEGLLLVPLLGWPAASASSPGRASRVIAITAAAALVIAPWIARNAIVFHRFMFAADGNTLIAGANCRDTYYGHDIGWWSLDCLARGRTLPQLEAGDASTATALRFAQHHLTRLPLVAAVRVLRTFDFFQPLRQGNRELRRKWVDVLGLIFYYPLLCLALLGLTRLRSARWVLLAPVWMVIIVSALGWGIGRFRVAADVSMIALAAFALASFAGAGRRAGRGRRPGAMPASGQPSRPPTPAGTG
jgi:hypothetical protein